MKNKKVWIVTGVLSIALVVGLYSTGTLFRGAFVPTAKLSVSLSSSPASQTVVQDATDVSAVGFSFQSGKGTPITVTGLTLTAHVDGNGDGVYDSTSTGSDGGVSVADLVASVSLYDPVTKTTISSSESVSSTGTVTFSGLSWVIASGKSGQLEVVVDTSSATTLSSNVAFSFDITNASTAVVAQDKAANAVTAKGTFINKGVHPTIIVTEKDAGTITVALSDDPVLDGVAIAGDDSAADPLLVSRYKVYASDEAFTVTKMQFENDSDDTNSYEDDDAISSVILKYPTSTATPTVLDGTASATLVAGTASFTGLNMEVPASVSGDENAVDVEVYVTTNPLTSSAAFSSGAQIEMDFDHTAGFHSIGQTSGTVVTESSASFLTTADVDANEIALYGALPSFAIASSSSQCSGSLTATPSDKVYCFGVTSSGGAVALYSLEFFADPNLLNTGTSSGQLAVASGWIITEYDSSGLIGSSLGNGTWDSSSNTVRITFTNEEVVADGATSYYVVQAPITYTDSTDTSSLSVYLQQDTSYGVNGVASSVSGNIVWSDRSASGHSTSTADWSNGYKLTGLPTTTFTSYE